MVTCVCSTGTNPMVPFLETATLELEVPKSIPQEIMVLKKRVAILTLYPAFNESNSPFMDFIFKSNSFEVVALLLRMVQDAKTNCV
jgi:hypothetical protein